MVQGFLLVYTASLLLSTIWNKVNRLHSRVDKVRLDITAFWYSIVEVDTFLYCFYMKAILNLSECSHGSDHTFHTAILSTHPIMVTYYKPQTTHITVSKLSMKPLTPPNAPLVICNQVSYRLYYEVLIRIFQFKGTFKAAQHYIMCLK